MLNEKRWKDVSELEQQWNEVTSGSSLFAGWSWASSWWAMWAESCDLKLQLYSFSADDGTLVAIVPLFTNQRKSRLGFTVNQLQVFGNIYPTGTTVLSEYSDILVRQGYEEDVSAALIRLLSNIQWDEFIIPYTTAGSFLFKRLQEHSNYFRFVDTKQEGPGVIVNAAVGFDGYLASLGKNTRLKLYNRRQLLQSLGPVKIEYANAAGIGEYLSELNGLDRSRWGRDCFGPQSLAFHVEIAGHASQRGELKLSRITVNCEVVSVLYNICFNGVEYNIQSAFKQDYHPKISLGTLHLGYAIERAFNDDEIGSFDLLYGEGKNTFYKQRLGGDEIQFYTILCGKTYRALLVFRTKVIFRRIKSVFRRFFPF